MASTTMPGPTTVPTVNSPQAKRAEVVSEAVYEKWNHWPIHWSGIWVGTLAALTAVLIFGLIGVALGFHVVGDSRVVDLKKIAIGTLAASIFSAFFAFVIGGWVAGKISGILRSEPAMLHGAIVWVIAAPILVFFSTLGAASIFGGWYAGLAGTPSWAPTASAPFARPDALEPNATPEERTQYLGAQMEYKRKVRQWEEESPKAARNAALGALTALLLGLMGSVLGGWLASGEVMTLTHHRHPSRSRVHILNS